MVVKGVLRDERLFVVMVIVSALESFKLASIRLRLGLLAAR